MAAPKTDVFRFVLLPDGCACVVGTYLASTYSETQLTYHQGETTMEFIFEAADTLVQIFGYIWAD